MMMGNEGGALGGLAPQKRFRSLQRLGAPPQPTGEQAYDPRTAGPGGPPPGTGGPPPMPALPTTPALGFKPGKGGSPGVKELDPPMGLPAAGTTPALPGQGPGGPIAARGMATRNRVRAKAFPGQQQPVGITPVAPPLPIQAPPAQPPPDGSLQGDVYAPGADPRLTGAQAGTDAAMGAISGADPYSQAAAGNEGRYRKLFGSGAVSGGPNVNAADGGRYLGDQDAAVAGLGGPSRTELAQKTMADFDKQGEAGLANRFRKVGQSAAKFGRMGMGDVNAELGSIQGDYERDRMAKQNELASSVAEGDIGDRFRRVDATSGLRRGESGIESGIRDEARSERGYDTGIDIGNQDRSFDRARTATDFGGRDASRDIQDRYDQFGAAGSLEDRVFGEGQQNRGEMRTERGYQAGQGQQSLENRIRQREMEERERENSFRRSFMQSQAGS